MSEPALVVPVKVEMPKGKSARAKVLNVHAQYRAGVYSAPEILPAEFTSAIKALEAALDKDIWLLVQNSQEQNFETLDDRIIEVLLDSKHSATGKRGVCLLLDSPGGMPSPPIRSLEH